MKKKLVLIIFGIIALATIMFAEYRYIMTHISICIGSNGNAYLEIFNQVDEYDLTEDVTDCYCDICQ